MGFGDFLRKNYPVGDKSVKDYLGRLNGILSKGIYNGETELSPSLIESVDKAYRGDAHYRTTLERYIAFQNKRADNIEGEKQ